MHLTPFTKLLALTNFEVNGEKDPPAQTMTRKKRK